MSKKELEYTLEDLKRHKSKKKAKPARTVSRRVWLLCLFTGFSLLFAVIIIFLILHKPYYYKPMQYSPPPGDEGQVSPYLSNQLMPQLHNGLQLGEPFDLVISQQGLNEIIAWSKWPNKSGDANLSDVAVLFIPGRLILMGKVSGGLEVIVTIMLEPKIDEQGLLNMPLTKVKLGALSITLLAKALAVRQYKLNIETENIDPEVFETQIINSLLHSKPFEPIFKVEGRDVRVQKLNISQKKLALRLAPLSE